MYLHILTLCKYLLTKYICICQYFLVSLHHDRRRYNLTPKSRKGTETMNEFKDALEKINGCIGTIKCGCSISADEGLYADSLYYRCKEYMRLYNEFKFGK